VKGNATKGTVTDVDGKFSMSIDDNNALIMISSFGFQKKEIPASKLINATITLEESSLLMDEVVVVGYGTKKKRDLTGSIASIGAKDLESSPVNDVLSAMQGKAAGVQITSNSGAPGDGITVRVRGFSSLNSGNEPLYVVDGIPIETASTSLLNIDDSHGLSPLSYLNPNDIESIEILKDAASSAIYGSRAANGLF
jgi:Outer membrane receptor for ferrienterochelin and colicins